MFVAGPPVVERLGQKLTKNELGGWQIQLKAGAVDHAVDTEEEAFACARRFLSYLPSSVDDAAAARPADRRSAAPRGVAVRRDPARPAQAVQDARDRRGGGRPRLVLRDRRRSTAARSSPGFARLDGWPVAMMASDPVPLRRRVDGGHLPEGRALRRHRADLPPAGRLSRGLPGLPHRARGRADGHDQAGRARDVGHLAVDGAVVRGDHPQRRSAWPAPPTSNGSRYCTRYAWPSGRWGSLPLEGGIEAAYRADLDAGAGSRRRRWPRSRSA